MHLKSMRALSRLAVQTMRETAVVDSMQLIAYQEISEEHEGFVQDCFETAVQTLIAMSCGTSSRQGLR